MVLFFFYGTLKSPSFLNYLAYVRPMIATNQARFVGEAITTEKYPFICVTERNIPAVYDYMNAEGAENVRGQLWECTENAGKGLDIIEGIPEGVYKRGTVKVKVLNEEREHGEEMEATIYFRSGNDADSLMEHWRASNGGFLSTFDAALHDKYTLKYFLSETMAHACLVPLEQVLAKTEDAVAKLDAADLPDAELSMGYADLWEKVLDEGNRGNVPPTVGRMCADVFAQEKATLSECYVCYEAAWCPDCKAVEPIDAFFGSPAAQGKKLIRVDVGPRVAYGDFKVEHGIKGVPALARWENGREVARVDAGLTDGAAMSSGGAAGVQKLVSEFVTKMSGTSSQR